MTKKFVVNVGGQLLNVYGPDNATQEQAQDQATRLVQKQQAADVERDKSSPLGRVLTNVAQGAAELVGGPMQLAHEQLGTPAPASPIYQHEENRPTTGAEKVERMLGAAGPLAPLGAVAPLAVGAAEGAASPAGTPTQRVINTGLGAVTGGVAGPMGARTASGLDRLASAAVGGHFFGPVGAAFAAHGRWAPLASLAHNFLSYLPPSVAAAVVSRLGYAPTQAGARQIDELSKAQSSPPAAAPQESRPAQQPAAQPSEEQDDGGQDPPGYGQ